jgi:hypothetical protein
MRKSTNLANSKTSWCSAKKIGRKPRAHLFHLAKHTSSSPHSPKPVYTNEELDLIIPPPTLPITYTTFWEGVAIEGLKKGDNRKHDLSEFFDLWEFH